MELTEFEKKVHALTALCQRLHAENSSLTEQLDRLRDDKQRLEHKLTETESRVTDILEKIKLMEQQGASS